MLECAVAQALAAKQLTDISVHSSFCKVANMCTNALTWPCRVPVQDESALHLAGGLTKKVTFGSDLMKV